MGPYTIVPWQFQHFLVLSNYFILKIPFPIFKNKYFRILLTNISLFPFTKIFFLKILNFWKFSAFLKKDIICVEPCPWHRRICFEFEKKKRPTIMGAKFSIQNTHTQNMKFHDFETNVFNTTLKNVPKQAFQDNSKKKKIF